MNFRSKALMLAKAISVWWGIYLILGCCACFSINMLLGIFGAEDALNGISKAVLIPSVAGGSLFLGIISYIISSVISTLPEKFFRRRLEKILRENGICREYTLLLSERLSGETKNITCSELALAYLLYGDFSAARRYIEQTDVVSVLDIAQSTGNYRAAAYYYAAAAVIYLALGNDGLARAAFENGRFYLDSLEKDGFVMSARALEQCLYGSPEEAAETAAAAYAIAGKTARTDIKAFAAGIKAHVLFMAGQPEAAAAAAEDALKIKISEEFEKNITELHRKIKDNLSPEDKKEPI